MFRNGIQIQHILLLLLVVLLIFGASRLPDIARNLGKSMKVMKEEIKDLRDDDAPRPQTPPAAPPAAPPQQGYTPPPGYTPPTGYSQPQGYTPPQPPDQPDGPQDAGGRPQV